MILNCIASLVLGASSAAAIPAQPAAIATAPTVVSDPSAEDELAGLEIISDEQLSNQRGGFVWQGVQIGLGAEIRTFLNGDLVLQTNISWTETGAQTTQFVSGALTPVDVAQLQAGILTSGGIRMNVGNNNVFLANNGQTAIIHNTEGGLQNILLNTASDVQVVSEVDAVLDLGNFDQFQQVQLDMRLGQSIGDMVAQSIISGP